MVDITTLPTGTDTAALVAVQQKADAEMQWYKQQWERERSGLRGDLARAQFDNAALRNEVNTLKGTDAEAARYAERVRARWFRRELARENRIRHHLIVAAWIVGGGIFGIPAALAISALLWRALWRVML